MNNRVFAEDMAYVIGCTGVAPTNIELPLIVTDSFKDTTVDILNLSQRAMNVLKRNKIFKLGQLMDNFEDVIRLRNCGKGTAKEIKNEFLAYWYGELTSEEIVAFWEDFIRVNGMETGSTKEKKTDTEAA